MSLNKILFLSEDFSIWLHQHTNETEFNKLVVREEAAICLFQQALDVEDGIRILLKGNLPGAALALARPLFECYVRGIWLLKAATDDDTDKFLSGKYYPEFDISKLAKAIGNNPETGGEWINAILDAHIKVLHDLTHGGTSHIISRCSLNTIEPRYPENHLISLVALGIEVKIRIGGELLAKLQKQDVLILLTEKVEYVRNQFQIITPDVSK